MLSEKTAEQTAADYLIDLHTTLVCLEKDKQFVTFFDGLRPLAEKVELHLFDHGLLTDRVFTSPPDTHMEMLNTIHHKLIVEEVETNVLEFDETLYLKGVAIETFMLTHGIEDMQQYFTVPGK